MFFKHTGEEKIFILIVYVNDIIVTENDRDEIRRLKEMLAKEFEIKDLGILRYFLGIEVTRSSKGIFVSQRKYVLNLLQETSMLGCKPAYTPIYLNHNLITIVESYVIDKGRYQRLVGKLIYLSHTRPDIEFAVSVVSQFIYSPCEVHMEVVMKILRYLKRSLGK